MRVGALTLLAGSLGALVLFAGGAAGAQPRPGITYYNLYGRGDRQVRLRHDDPCNEAVRGVPRDYEWHEAARMTGLSRRAVRRCFGSPGTRAARRWTFTLNSSGCSEFALEIEVAFDRRGVTHARSRWRGTGEVCDPFSW